MPMKKSLLIMVLLTGVLIGCTPPEIPAPESTATLSPTFTPTITVEWFPPTETPTPFPTVTAAAAESSVPEKGEVIYSEEFKTLGDWLIPQTSRGEINLDRSRMNVVIREPNTYLAAVMGTPKFDDFFAEITVSPNLCQGKDEYGVLFRAAGNSSYYRYSLSCDGELRLDRVQGGEVAALQPWTSSASVPPAAPSESRLGILAESESLSFFINDVFQFSVVDSGIREGSMGIFARSVDGQAVTVSFSSLIVREVLSPQGG